MHNPHIYLTFPARCHCKNGYLDLEEQQNLRLFGPKNKEEIKGLKTSSPKTSVGKYNLSTLLLAFVPFASGSPLAIPNTDSPQQITESCFSIVTFGVIGPVE